MAQSTFELCDTETKLDAVVKSLQDTNMVFLDCEGRILGSIGGCLSLLNLGKVEKGNNGIPKLFIYLIDVLAFDGERMELLRPIFDIIESKKVIKVVFDGRMDASELLHGHNVTLQCVIDLQVADIVSRAKRGESESKRLQRLGGYVPWHELSTNTAGYKNVYRLNGLQYALNEHGLSAQTGKKSMYRY
jgi:exonuclease 3'-5' domain-containing protein 1